MSVDECSLVEKTRVYDMLSEGSVKFQRDAIYDSYLFT